MAVVAERAALLKAVTTIDKKIDWREERIKEYRAEIDQLMGERDQLSARYRELNPIDTSAWVGE